MAGLHSFHRCAPSVVSARLAGSLGRVLTMSRFKPHEGRTRTPTETERGQKSGQMGQNRLSGETAETSRLGTLSIVAESPFDSSAEGERATRIDARASRETILSVAADAVAGDRRMSMVELAAAAGVGRSTLYRHSPAGRR